jgi:hypothetical protein
MESMPESWLLLLLLEASSEVEAVEDEVELL